LIRNAVLQRIADGEVDTLFRRQARPTVKACRTLRTAIGLLDIVAVDRIELDDVSDDDARRAGMADRHAVRAMLEEKSAGDDYRVRVRLGGVDPREVLRAADDLSDDELTGVRARLERIDALSPHGPWTRAVLRLIAARPHVRAADLAASIDLDTPTFKADVKKLKAIGLTISHSPGYELSARGRAVLERLDRAG